MKFVIIIGLLLGVGISAYFDRKAKDGPSETEVLVSRNEEKADRCKQECVPYPAIAFTQHYGDCICDIGQRYRGAY